MPYCVLAFSQNVDSSSTDNMTVLFNKLVNSVVCKASEMLHGEFQTILGSGFTVDTVLDVIQVTSSQITFV